MTEESNRPMPDKSAACRAHVHAQPVVSFEAISEGANEILIECEGQMYHLRKTRNGRLVLNK